MGLGKITRDAGKAGSAIEALGYLWIAGSALVKLVRGKRSSGDDAGDPHGNASDRRGDDQPELKGEQ